MSQPKFDVFGIDVSCTSGAKLAQCIEGWAATSDQAEHVICFSDAHAMVKGHDDREMHHALTSADVVVPDGHPVAWIGRTLHGVPAQRICGPDFFALLTSRSPKTGLSHYLFGGKPGVAEALAATLAARHPGIAVVGFDSPPMGDSSLQVTEEQLARIRAARPDVVWVGLGAPKQEIWMARYRHRLPGITLCGVGAAFDFHTGRVQRAPAWMSRTGLEWAYRCLREPRRLGPRYAKTIPRFLFLLTQQIWRMQRNGALESKTRQAARRI